MPIIPTANIKILSYYHEIKKIKAGKIPIPRCIKIILSQICNHKCQGCHSASLFSKKYPYLDANLYFRLVDEWLELGVEGINLTGGGEPLMHPQIGKLIEYSGKKGMGIGILTNGTFLNEKIMAISLAYSTYIRIGIDAGSPEVYKGHAGVDHFEFVIRKIKRLIKLRTRMNSKTTIGLKFLITKNNFKDIEKACLLAAELGVDYLHFKPSRNNRYEINPSLVNRINKVIENKRVQFEGKDFHIFGHANKTKAKSKCFLNMLSTILDTDGSLYICNFFQNRKQSHRLGNVSNKTFSEVWFDKKHIEKVNMIKTQECQLYSCPMHGAHDVVKKYILENKLHLQFI